MGTQNTAELNSTPQKMYHHKSNDQIKFNHRITGYQVGMELKGNLVRPFSWQKHSLDKVAQHSVWASLKSPVLGTLLSSTSPRRLFQWLIVLIVKNFPRVQSESFPGVTCTSYPAFFHVIPSKKGVSIFSVDTF